MGKPVDITTEQWEQSKKKARSYLLRAYNTFPNQTKTFYVGKVQTYIKADLFTKNKGAK
jgi:hypothetical protein